MKKFLSILTVLLFAFAFSWSFVSAGAPTFIHSAGTTDIDGVGAGPLTGSGTEAGTHTIVVTDATKSSITSGTIPITVHGKIDVVIDGTNEDLTLVMGGETIAITLTHTDHTTTIGDVALDIATQIGLSAYTGTVTVTAPGGNTIKIEIDKAGSSNSIDPISGISGGAATALLFNNDGITAGTNAKAVDTFTPATNSNGLWYAGNSDSYIKTIEHNTPPGTISTLAGLETLVTAADAFVEGLQISVAAALAEGTATITITPGTPGSVTITTEPIQSYIYQNLNSQPVVRVWDDALNGTTAEVTIKAYTSCDSGTPANFDTVADPDFTGTLTNAGTNGTATFSGVKYNSVNTSGILLKATAGGVSNACNALTGFAVYGTPGSTTTTHSTGTTPTTTAPQTTTTTTPETTTTPAPAATTMPQPAKPIAEMNQAEKNGYVMQLQQFLITLLTQLLTLLQAR